MIFTSLSLGLLICEMGIKRPTAQVCAGMKTQGSGMASHLSHQQYSSHTFCSSFPCGNSQIEAEAENEVHKTPRTFKGPLSVYLEKRACLSSCSAGPWALTWQI